MPKRILVWTAVAGFGFAGLFDSILLHRILKWHHLMSLAAPEAGVLEHNQWDASFDTVSFAVLVIGLSALLIHRAALVQHSGARIAGAALVGFGLWHVVDAVVVHWLLGWHRIRASAPDPLFWDLLWPGLFGVVPLVLAVPLLRGRAAAARGTGGTAPPLPRFEGSRHKRKGPPHAP